MTEKNFSSLIVISSLELLRRHGFELVSASFKHLCELAQHFRLYLLSRPIFS